MASASGGTILWVLDVDTSKFDTGLAKASSEAKSVGTGMDKTGSSIGTAFSAIGKSAIVAGTGIAVAGAAIGIFGKRALDMTSDFQQSRLAFDTMLGSAEKGAKIMRELSDFAKKTPFQLPEVVQGAKALLAYGISADKIIPTFNSLGNIAAGVGKDKLPQLTLAFGQVRTAGRLTGMELRQFTEAGVPLLDELAKQSGKSAAQIKDDMENGMAPSFEEVENAIFAMTNNGGKFYNLMEKQSMTFSGRVSNIMDTVGQTIRGILGVDVEGNVAPGSIFDRVTKAAEGLMTWLETNKETIINAVQSIFDFISEHGDIIAVFIGTVLVGAFIKLAVAIATATWPILLIAAAVTGLYILFQAVQPYLVAFWQSFMNSARPVIDWFKAYVLPVLEQIASFVMNQLKQAWDQFSKAIQDLWAQIQPFIPQLKILAMAIGIGLALAIGIFVGAILLAIAVVVAIIVVVARVIGFLAELGAAISQASIAFWNAVKDRFEAVVSFFREFPGKITGALGNVGSLLYNAGRDLVAGLVNGIKSMAGAAADAAKGVAKSAVDGAKSLLGINSPSKVFAGIGMNIGQGLAEGVMSTQGLVDNAISSLTAPSISGAGTEGGGSSISNTIGNINIAGNAQGEIWLQRLTREDEVTSKGLTA